MSATQTRAASPTLQDSDTDEQTVEELSKDDVFHLLQNKRRRLALRYLSGEDGTVEMRDIAEQVAAWEHDTTLQQLTSDQRQRVYISLYQCHLPKLDDKGVIEYNQPRGMVTRTPVAEQLDQYLVDMGADDDTAEESGNGSLAGNSETSVYAVGGLGMAAVVSLLSAFDVSLFAQIPDAGIALAVLCVCALLTLRPGRF